MSSNFKKILVTGLPGVGKTTLLKKVWQNLGSFSPVGFYTDEIKEKGIRKGFELISLKGERKLLSHVNISKALTRSASIE